MGNATSTSRVRLQIINTATVGLKEGIRFFRLHVFCYQREKERVGEKKKKMAGRKKGGKKRRGHYASFFHFCWRSEFYSVSPTKVMLLTSFCKRERWWIKKVSVRTFWKESFDQSVWTEYDFFVELSCDKLSRRIVILLFSSIYASISSLLLMLLHFIHKFVHQKWL